MFIFKYTNNNHYTVGACSASFSELQPTTLVRPHASTITNLNRWHSAFISRGRIVIINEGLQRTPSVVQYKQTSLANNHSPETAFLYEGLDTIKYSYNTEKSTSWATFFGFFKAKFFVRIGYVAFDKGMAWNDKWKILPNAEADCPFYCIISLFSVKIVNVIRISHSEYVDLSEIENQELRNVTRNFYGPFRSFH